MSCPMCDGAGIVINGEITLSVKRPGAEIEIKGLCPECWGSGDAERPGVKWFGEEITAKQIKLWQRYRIAETGDMATITDIFAGRAAGEHYETLVLVKESSTVGHEQYRLEEVVQKIQRGEWELIK